MSRWSYEERVERFWKGFRRSHGHLIWMGSEDEGGYGQIRWEGRTRRTHVVAFELTYGPLPAGKQVNHIPECLLRNCGEPTHLYAGTQAQNTADRLRHELRAKLVLQEIRDRIKSVMP